MYLEKEGTFALIGSGVVFISAMWNIRISIAVLLLMIVAFGILTISTKDQPVTKCNDCCR